MLVGYRVKDRAVFLFGFAKNELANIEDNELLSLREAAGRLLAADDERIQKEIELGNLQEVDHDDDTE